MERGGAGEGERLVELGVQSATNTTVAAVRGEANVDRNRFDGSVAQLRIYSGAVGAARGAERFVASA